MKASKTLLTVLPVITGLAMLQLANPGQSTPLKKLKSVKFVEASHMVSGQNISQTSADGKLITTTLPDTINDNLKVNFIFKWSGPSNGAGNAYINPMTNQSMIQCYAHSLGNNDTTKNKVGYCFAKKGYLAQLDEDTTVKLRVSSPGGGGNKYLNWKFIPPEPKPDNYIDRLQVPGSVTKGDSLFTQVVLAHPAEGPQTINWAFYPKSCFALEGSRRPVGRDLAKLTGSVTFQPGEVQRSVQVLTQACSASSAVMEAWYADPGESANTNMNSDINKSFNLVSPRR